MSYGHDCEHTSLQHGADGCNVPGCLCAFMSWDASAYDEEDEEFTYVRHVPFVDHDELSW